MDNYLVMWRSSGELRVQNEQLDAKEAMKLMDFLVERSRRGDDISGVVAIPISEAISYGDMDKMASLQEHADEDLKCPDCTATHDLYEWHKSTAKAFDCGIHEIGHLYMKDGKEKMFACPNCGNEVAGAMIIKSVVEDEGDE